MEVNNYKPEYLGKVLPSEQTDATEFMHNKFEPFSKIYDTCKAESSKIEDISNTSKSSDSSLSVKLVVNDSSALDNINKEAQKNNDSVQVNGDTITAK